MVWVWQGEPALIPTVSCMDDRSLAVVDFQMDLPYDQGYLIENVIDVAHIHIAHDGMRGGGVRAAAKPLQFDLLESSRDGIRSTFRSMGLVADDGQSPLKAAVVEFIPPNLIRYTSDYRNEELIAGLSLYSLPQGKGRCRLLYRKYSNFTPWSESLKPRWLEHWIQCTILEQDMAVVIGQYEHTERSQRQLKELWQPLKTSDFLVVEYRKWLDRFGQGFPSFRGYSTHKTIADDSFTIRAATDRFALHTRICGTCSRMYRRIERAQQGLWVLVAGLASVALLSGSGRVAQVSVGLALASLLAIAGLRRMRRQFG